MDMGRRQQVFATGHQSDALAMIVEGDREMIAGRGVAPAENHIPQNTGLDGEDPARLVFPMERSRGLARLGAVEAERIGLPRRDAPGTVGRREGPAGAGIERALRAPAWRTLRGADSGGDLRLDLLAAAEAGIEQAAGGEGIEGRAIVASVIGLPAHRRLPLKPQPGKVLEDARLEFGPAAAAVDILDAQEEAPAALSRAVGGEERGVRMAEMEAARRAGREAGDDSGHRGSVEACIA